MTRKSAFYNSRFAQRAEQLEDFEYQYQCALKTTTTHPNFLNHNDKTCILHFSEMATQMMRKKRGARFYNPIPRDIQRLDQITEPAKQEKMQEQISSIKYYIKEVYKDVKRELANQTHWTEEMPGLYGHRWMQSAIGDMGLADEDEDEIRGTQDQPDETDEAQPDDPWLNL